MPKITRIKASDSGNDKDNDRVNKSKRVKTAQKAVKTSSKVIKTVKTSKTKINKKDKKVGKKPTPKFLRILAAPFVFITKPFRPLGRYIKASWQEIRQVRWPDRKNTWKMTLSVIIYVIIFATAIMLLDVFFTFIFNKLLGV